MLEHIGFVLAFARRQAGEVLLNKDHQLLAVVKPLFTCNRYLFGIRPGEHGCFRQPYGDHVVREKSTRNDACRTALDTVLKFTAAGKAGAGRHDTIVAQIIDLTASQTYAYRIVTNSKFHGALSFLVYRY